MAKRAEFVIERKDEDGHWQRWTSPEVSSTAEALLALKAGAGEGGEYRVIQVKARVKLDIVQVSKVKVQHCGGAKP